MTKNCFILIDRSEAIDMIAGGPDDAVFDTAGMSFSDVFAARYGAFETERDARESGAGVFAVRAATIDDAGTLRWSEAEGPRILTARDIYGYFGQDIPGDAIADPIEVEAKQIESEDRNG